jgi:hypothetical protein
MYNLLEQKHKYDYATCHGTANYAKWQYIIENCTYYPDGTLYDWTGVSQYRVLNFYYQNRISDEIIREISHNSPWDVIWGASRKTGDVFDRKGVALTSDQLRLVMWSSMYDNIREAHDCPGDDIIKDDDMLDGWLIIKRREREKENRKHAVENKTSKNPRIANADEIYQVAKTLKEAQEIDSMNNPHIRALKKQRFNYIRKHGGAVKEQDLPDVRQKKMMAMNRAETQTMRDLHGKSK